MSAIAALEADILRVLSEAGEVRNALGSPLRVSGGEGQKPGFPFLRVSAHEVRGDGVGTVGPREHRLSLEVLSRAGGRAEASRLVALIADTLRGATLTPEGQHVVLFHPVYADVFLRADGTTFRGLLRLRALMEEE